MGDLAAVDGMRLGDGRVQIGVVGQQVVGHRHRLQRIAQFVGQHRQKFDLAQGGRIGAVDVVGHQAFAKAKLVNASFKNSGEIYMATRYYFSVLALGYFLRATHQPGPR